MVTFLEYLNNQHADIISTMEVEYRRVESLFAFI